MAEHYENGPTVIELQQSANRKGGLLSDFVAIGVPVFFSGEVCEVVGFDGESHPVVRRGSETLYVLPNYRTPTSNYRPLWVPLDPGVFPRMGSYDELWAAWGYTAVSGAGQRHIELHSYIAELNRKTAEQRREEAFEAAQRARDAAANAPHYVYRYYSGSGELLYVGMTRHPEQRDKAHRSKPWYPLVERRTLTECPSLHDAQKAEATAIKSENPLYNVQGIKTNAERAELTAAAPG